MSKTFRNESLDYRAARNQLLDQEIELRCTIEAVAAARRALPPGGAINEDYRFEEAGDGGQIHTVRFSELFAPDRDTLVIFNFMFGPKMEKGCPYCTSQLDSIDTAAPHITQRVNLVVVARSPLPRILDHARGRGWNHLRLLSSASNSYNVDYFGENDNGDQRPMLNVFHRDNGTIHHFWGSELL